MTGLPRNFAENNHLAAIASLMGNDTVVEVDEKEEVGEQQHIDEEGGDADGTVMETTTSKAIPVFMAARASSRLKAQKNSSSSGGGGSGGKMNRTKPSSNRATRRSRPYSVTRTIPRCDGGRPISSVTAMKTTNTTSSTKTTATTTGEAQLFLQMWKL